jgi:integrase
MTKKLEVLNRTRDKDDHRQVCGLLGESKNLAPKQKTKTVSGELHGTADVKGLITKYMAWLEKEGYNTKSSYPKLLQMLSKAGANLHDPESVKEAIAKLHCKDGTKMLCVYAYEAFAKMEKIAWNRPRYKQEETLPFVPDEAELDSLIASCQSRRMAAFLQSLKETYADPGEVLRLRWIDISGNIITINNPVKGHLPGQLEVTNKLLAMLDCLPKASERIFPATYMNIYTSFDKVRRRAARMLQNPRLLKISFKSFRHWGGSMIAHYTNGNVLTVKKLLRHKRIENTMKYISMIHFEDDEFEVTTATTVDEAKQVLSAGFNYITEKNGVMLFRRPKRFRGLNARLGV